jgi:hypothetical protein
MDQHEIIANQRFAQWSRYSERKALRDAFFVPVPRMRILPVRVMHEAGPSAKIAT